MGSGVSNKSKPARKRSESGDRQRASRRGNAAKEAKGAVDSTRPGAIELTVENVLDTDSGYDVLVDSELRKSAVTGKTCALMGVAPGLHELAVTSAMSGAPAHASQIVNVTAGAWMKVSITLAKAKVIGAA